MKTDCGDARRAVPSVASMLSPSSRTSDWRPIPVLIALATVLATAYSGCPLLREAASPGPTASVPVVGPLPAPPLTLSPAARLHVLMINGGHDPANNYQSHLLHVQRLLDVLRATGVLPQHVMIFSADGADPAADLAVREQDTWEDLWRLNGTTLEGSLRAPITHINSEVPGVELHAATKEAIGAWFDEAANRLRPGDVLLLYVTDHGTKNRDDLTDNQIVLWGKDEDLSVRELRALLDKLDPGVRVVTLMSQCYSGAFSGLMRTDHAGATCGYFSSTPERRAYGCYPENRGRENVGHSFHFIEALATTGSFPEAHARTLVGDASPDVPLTTSDAYLHTLLGHAAESGDQSFSELVDALLMEAWRNKGAWEPEIRLLDRIGVAYGCFSPRSLGELDEQAKQLPDISSQFQTVSNAWNGALASANQAQVDRFLRARPDWKLRGAADALDKLDGEARRALLAAFLDDLKQFTATDPDSAAHLSVLNDKGDAATAWTYRMEVRLAVILRLRSILTSIAGQVYVATRATPDERAFYEGLARCERLALPAVPLGAKALATPEPFPPFEEDVQRAQAALPAWMGIQFREVSKERREEMKLQEGATAVVTVYPDSPAARAGLQLGDIIIGPPRHPFTHRGEVREWTMLTPAGSARALDVLHEDQPLQVSLAPEPYPLKWPELPGPPKLATAAPPISKLVSYRGLLPPSLVDGTQHLLFFWATWCGPCKASLPEVLAFEHDRGTPVIAVTDEAADHLDMFFKTFPMPFPETVAIDEFRHAFVSYGVSGTPTFVLVDGKGIVRSYSTGYAPQTGLGIDGWSWVGTAPK